MKGCHRKEKSFMFSISHKEVLWMQREAKTKCKLCLLKWMSTCVTARLLWGICQHIQQPRTSTGAEGGGFCWLCLHVYVCVSACVNKINENRQSVKKGGLFGRWAEGWICCRIECVSHLHTIQEAAPWGVFGHAGMPDSFNIRWRKRGHSCHREWIRMFIKTQLIQTHLTISDSTAAVCARDWCSRCSLLHPFKNFVWNEKLCMAKTLLDLSKERKNFLKSTK